MRNFAATTSTTAAQRTTAVCGSSTRASARPGRSGWNGGRGDSPSVWKGTRRSCAVIRPCAGGSHTLGPEQRQQKEMIRRKKLLPHGGESPRGVSAVGYGTTDALAGVRQRGRLLVACVRSRPGAAFGLANDGRRVLRENFLPRSSGFSFAARVTHSIIALHLVQANGLAQDRPSKGRLSMSKSPSLADLDAGLCVGAWCRE